MHVVSSTARVMFVSHHSSRAPEEWHIDFLVSQVLFASQGRGTSGRLPAWIQIEPWSVSSSSVRSCTEACSSTSWQCMDISGRVQVEHFSDRLQAVGWFVGTMSLRQIKAWGVKWTHGSPSHHRSMFGSNALASANQVSDHHIMTSIPDWRWFECMFVWVSLHIMLHLSLFMDRKVGVLCCHHHHHLLSPSLCIHWSGTDVCGFCLSQTSSGGAQS